jgi:hypothetical protein
VGDGGVILTATDPTVDTGSIGGWIQIQSTLTPNNLQTIDYSPVWNKINIAGEDGIFHSSAVTINFSQVISNAPNENLDLTRITFYGGSPLVNDTSMPTAAEQIVNGTIFSATVVDTGYSANIETTYYLVIGNMKNATVLAGQVYLQATEVKR